MTAAAERRPLTANSLYEGLMWASGLRALQSLDHSGFQGSDTCAEDSEDWRFLPAPAGVPGPGRPCRRQQSAGP